MRILDVLIVVLGLVAFALCVLVFIEEGKPAQMLGMMSGFFVNQSLEKLKAKK